MIRRCRALGIWPAFLLALVFALSSRCVDADEDDAKYRQAREAMVSAQIIGRGVRHADVLRAMRTVPRHRFVPYGQRRHAYADRPLPIGSGQTISQPYIVALMTAALEPGPQKRVLEVGTGSGYQAAVLAELCREVYSIEIISALGRGAEMTLKDLGYGNVHIRIGDGYQGWPEAAPFDAIIVTCSPTHIPRPLEEQLAEGGLMVIPVGERSAQELVLLRKVNGRILQENIIPVRFVPMMAPDGKRY
ncbi:MAG: protein-L-isoaspartate(D-aspartate) O-methyltransferase [Pseudomonadota bacterium]